MNQDNELADSWVSVDTHEDNSFTSFNSLGSSFPSTPASPRKERAGHLSPSLFQEALIRLQANPEEPEPMDLSNAASREEKEPCSPNEGERALNLDTYDMVHLTKSMEQEIYQELEKLREEQETVPLKGEPEEAQHAPSHQKEENKESREEIKEAGASRPTETLMEGAARQSTPPPTTSSTSRPSHAPPPSAFPSAPLPTPAVPAPSSSSLPSSHAPSFPFSSSLLPPLHSWNPTSPEALMEDRHLKDLPKFSQTKGLRHRKNPSELSRNSPPTLSLSESPLEAPPPEAESDFFELRINRKKLSMTFLLSALFVSHFVAFGMGVICDRKFLLTDH